MADDPSPAPEPARWIKLRASAAERARWQALAASRGVSLSELIRASLGGLRLRARREPPAVAPELLRELARIGNNLNQLARAANRHEPVTATALPCGCGCDGGERCPGRQAEPPAEQERPDA